MNERTDEDLGTGHGSASAPRALRGLSRWLPLGAAVAAVLVADQLTKAWAFDRLCDVQDGYACLAHAEPIHVVWTLQWNLAFNTGMAFSRGSGSGPIIGVVVLVIVAVLLLVARKVASRAQLLIIGVVVGGALGNLVDRLVRAEDGFMSGAVVDFVDVQWWPIWNVADMAVVLGGIALALTGFSTEQQGAEGEDDDGATAASDDASTAPAPSDAAGRDTTAPPA